MEGGRGRPATAPTPDRLRFFNELKKDQSFQPFFNLPELCAKVCQYLIYFECNSKKNLLRFALLLPALLKLTCNTRQFT